MTQKMGENLVKNLDKISLENLLKKSLSKMERNFSYLRDDEIMMMM